MRRMSRFKRKRTVRWLPDTSNFDEVTRHAFNQADGTSWQFLKDTTLIAYDDPVPAALQPNLAASGVGISAGRQPGQSLIIDHIKGKVSWLMDGAGLSGLADADGLWLFVIRTSIGIVTRPTEETLGGGAVAANPLWAGGTMNTNLSNLMDPGAPVPVFNQGSFGPDGARILWRRDWMFTLRCGSGFASGSTGTDSPVASPGGYIDIKPKRILRPNEGLYVAINAQAVPQAGATGGCGIVWGHDLRVAAHNTQRRR